MSDIAQEFIDLSRRFLLKEYLRKIERCVDELPDEDLWWRPNDVSNSVGNLLLHLAGNVRQWIVHGVGGRPDTRQRQQEFDERGPIPAPVLLARLREALDEADGVLADFDPADLSHRLHVQGLEVTAMEAIYHVVEHFSTHVGQIIYLTKLSTGRDLRFYAMNADGSVRRGWLGEPQEGDRESR